MATLLTVTLDAATGASLTAPGMDVQSVAVGGFEVATGTLAFPTSDWAAPTSVSVAANGSVTLTYLTGATGTVVLWVGAVALPRAAAIPVLVATLSPDFVLVDQLDGTSAASGITVTDQGDGTSLITGVVIVTPQSDGTTLIS